MFNNKTNLATVSAHNDFDQTIFRDAPNSSPKKPNPPPFNKFGNVEFPENVQAKGLLVSLPNAEDTSGVTALIPGSVASAEITPISVLQNWEGSVEAVNDTFFTARLLDKTNGENLDEEMAEIPLDEIDPNDRDLLRVGAIFFLSVVRQVQNGRNVVTTRMIFRRLPMWHDRTLNDAKASAESLFKFFSSNRHDTASE
jgi:hypothetical protein